MIRDLYLKYTKNLNNSVKKITQFRKKCSNDMNRILSREDIQIVNRHMKRCSTSLAIREIQTQIRMRDHFTCIMAVTKNQIVINVVKDVEKS